MTPYHEGWIVVITVLLFRSGLVLAEGSVFIVRVPFDSIAPRPKPGHSGRACRAEGNPFGHTSRLSRSGGSGVTSPR